MQYKVRTPDFDENEHPRDRKGRFIETGAEVRIWGGQSGTVLRNVGGGKIEVQRADGQKVVVHRNYLTVTASAKGDAPTTDPDQSETMTVEAPSPDAQEVPELAEGDDVALPDRGDAPDRLVEDTNVGEEVGDYTVGEYVDGPSAIDGWVVDVTDQGGPIIRTAEGQDWPLLPDAEMVRDPEGPEVPDDLIGTPAGADPATADPADLEDEAIAVERGRVAAQIEKVRDRLIRDGWEEPEPAPELDALEDREEALAQEQYRREGLTIDRADVGPDMAPRARRDRGEAPAAAGDLTALSDDDLAAAADAAGERADNARTTDEARAAIVDMQAVSAEYARRREALEATPPAPPAPAPAPESRVVESFTSANGTEVARYADGTATIGGNPATIEQFNEARALNEQVGGERPTNREWVEEAVNAPAGGAVAPETAAPEQQTPAPVETPEQQVPVETPGDLDWNDASSVNENDEDFQTRFNEAQERLLDTTDGDDPDIGGYRSYVAGMSDQMNAHLRGSTPDIEQTGDIDRLDKIIDRYGLVEDRDLTVFRGMDASEEGTFDPGAVNVGDVVTDDGFLSTTYALAQAEPYGDWTYRISVPAGTKWVPGNGGGGIAENEVLLPRGGTLTITAVDPDAKRVEATYAAPDAPPAIPGEDDDDELPTERPEANFPDATGDPIPAGDPSLSNSRGSGVDNEQFYRLDFNSDFDDLDAVYPMNPMKGQAFRINGAGINAAGQNYLGSTDDVAINFTAEDGSIGQAVLPRDVPLIPVSRPEGARRSESEVAERQNARRARGEEIDFLRDSATEPYDEPEAAATPEVQPATATTPIPSRWSFESDTDEELKKRRAQLRRQLRTKTPGGRIHAAITQELDAVEAEQVRRLNGPDVEVDEPDDAPLPVIEQRVAESFALGYEAYVFNGMRAPAMNPDVMAMIDPDAPVGDEGNRRIMLAFTQGFDKAGNDDLAGSLVDPRTPDDEDEIDEVPEGAIGASPSQGRTTRYTLPDGSVATRSSKGRTYSHVVVSQPATPEARKAAFDRRADALDRQADLLEKAADAGVVKIKDRRLGGGDRGPDYFHSHEMYLDGATTESAKRSERYPLVSTRGNGEGETNVLTKYGTPVPEGVTVLRETDDGDSVVRAREYLIATAREKAASDREEAARLREEGGQPDPGGAYVLRWTSNANLGRSAANGEFAREAEYYGRTVTVDTVDPDVDEVVIDPEKERLAALQAQVVADAGLEAGRIKVQGNLFVSQGLGGLREGDVLWTMGEGTEADPVRLMPTRGGVKNPNARQRTFTRRSYQDGRHIVLNFTDGTSTGKDGGAVIPEKISGSTRMAHVPVRDRLAVPPPSRGVTAEVAAERLASDGIPQGSVRDLGVETFTGTSGEVIDRWAAGEELSGDDYRELAHEVEAAQELRGNDQNRDDFEYLIELMYSRAGDMDDRARQPAGGSTIPGLVDVSGRPGVADMTDDDLRAELDELDTSNIDEWQAGMAESGTPVADTPALVAMRERAAAVAREVYDREPVTRRFNRSVDGATTSFEHTTPGGLALRFDSDGNWEVRDSAGNALDGGLADNVGAAQQRVNETADLAEPRLSRREARETPVERFTFQSSEWVLYADGHATVGGQNVSEMGYEQARSQFEQLDGGTVENLRSRSPEPDAAERPDPKVVETNGRGPTRYGRLPADLRPGDVVITSGNGSAYRERLVQAEETASSAPGGGQGLFPGGNQRRTIESIDGDRVNLGGNFFASLSEFAAQRDAMGRTNPGKHVLIETPEGSGEAFNFETDPRLATVREDLAIARDAERSKLERVGTYNRAIAGINNARANDITDAEASEYLRGYADELKRERDALLAEPDPEPEQPTVGAPEFANPREAADYIAAQIGDPDIRDSVQAYLNPTTRAVNGIYGADGMRNVERHPDAERLVPMVLTARSGVVRNQYTGAPGKPGRKWDGATAQAALNRLSAGDPTLPANSVGRRASIEVLDMDAPLVYGAPAAKKRVEGVVDSISESTGGVYVRIIDDSGEPHVQAMRADATVDLVEAPSPTPGPDPEPVDQHPASAISNGDPEPLETFYLRNPQSLGADADPGAFGRDIEPAGRYMSIVQDMYSVNRAQERGWETGSIRFEKPLHMDFGGTYGEDSNWKNRLSAHYGGLTGQALSDAVRADGYDAIITNDVYGDSEVVDLTNGGADVTPGPDRTGGTAPTPGPDPEPAPVIVPRSYDGPNGTLTEGMVVARDLRGQVVLERLVSIGDQSVGIRSTDGYTESYPLYGEGDLARTLDKYRPATPEEVSRFEGTDADLRALIAPVPDMNAEMDEYESVEELTLAIKGIDDNLVTFGPDETRQALIYRVRLVNEVQRRQREQTPPEPDTSPEVTTTSTRASEVSVGQTVLFDDGTLATIEGIEETDNGLIEFEYRDADGLAGSYFAEPRAMLDVVDAETVQPPAPAPDQNPEPSAERTQQVLGGDVIPGDTLWMGNDKVTVTAVEPNDADTVSITVRFADRRTETFPFGREAALDRADDQFLPDSSPLDSDTRTSRPVLYTYQRRNIVALGLDTDGDPMVAEAARRIRLRQPLAAAHSAALAQRLTEMASSRAVKPQRQRMLLRLAAANNAASIEAGGRGVEIPDMPNADRVTKGRPADAGIGDQIAFLGLNGALVQGRVTESRTMMSGRLTQVTVEGPDGEARTVMLTRNSDVYVLPDLPEPTPVPQPEDTLPEVVDLTRLRVGDVVRISNPQMLMDGEQSRTEMTVMEIGGNLDENEAAYVIFDAHSPYSEEDDQRYVMTVEPGRPADEMLRIRRGADSADQPRDTVTPPLNPETVRADEIEVGDWISHQRNNLSRTSEGIVTEATDLLNEEGERIGRRVHLKKPTGGSSWETMMDGEEYTTTRLIKGDQNTILRMQERKRESQRAARAFSASHAISEPLDQYTSQMHYKIVQNALRGGGLQDEFYGDAIFDAFTTGKDVTTSLDDDRFRAIGRMTTNLQRELSGESSGLAFNGVREAAAQLAQEIVNDYHFKLQSAFQNVRPIEPGESRAAAGVALARAIHAPENGWTSGNTYEQRDLMALARGVVAAREAREAADLPEASGPVEVPRVPDGSLRERMAAYKARLGSRVGFVDSQVASFGTFDLDSLERGEVPEITVATTRAKDKANDGGPGETAMAQLEVLRAAGADIDASINERVRAAFADEVLTPQMTEDAGITADNITIEDVNYHLDVVLQARKEQAHSRYDNLATARNDLYKVIQNRLAREAGYDDYEAVRQGVFRSPAGDAREGVRAVYNDIGVKVRTDPDYLVADEASNAAYEEYKTTAERWVDFKARLAEVRAKAARDVLAEVRDMGGVELPYTGAGRRNYETTTKPLRGGDTMKAMRFAEQHYPTEWLNALNNNGRGALSIGSSKRGFFLNSAWIIRLSADDNRNGRTPWVPPKGRVAVHELGHAMETTIPGLSSAEEAFLWARTSEGEIGERTRTKRKRIDSSTSYLDEFKESYSGKDYADGTHYELFTTGAESLFAGSDYMDDDYRQWLLGTMALL
jgi:hypothetical protein